MIESSVSQGFAEILSGSLAYLETIPGYGGEKKNRTVCKHTQAEAQTHTLTCTNVQHQDPTCLDVYSNLIRFAAGGSLVERKSADLKRKLLVLLDLMRS